MVVYYISYGEPQRQPLWQPLLLILLIILALAMAAAIAYGIYELASGNAPDTLEDVLLDLRQDDPNSTYWIDTSKSISESGYLDEVKKALETVARSYTEGGAGQAVEGSRATLVPFTDNPKSSLELASLEIPEESDKLIGQVRDLKESDEPAYIYDAIAAAHEALEEQSDSGRANVIVLLTDGQDGGLMEVDLTRLTACPQEIPTVPGEVCSPVFEQIPVDIDELVLCPAEVATVAGEVCNPVPNSADETVIGYEPINPDDLDACPPELDGANVLCYDDFTGYQLVNRDELDTCPMGFTEPGKACMAVQSEIDRDDLIVLLARSKVKGLKVHIIGLSPVNNRESLELLAFAGRGKYIHCSSGKRCQVPE